MPPTSSFWSKNGRKALKIKGWKVPNQLVRMRSAVRIRPAAPQRDKVYFVPLFLCSENHSLGEWFPKAYGDEGAEKLPLL